jgi:hypothetical protein
MKLRIHEAALNRGGDNQYKTSASAKSPVIFRVAAKVALVVKIHRGLHERFPI